MVELIVYQSLWRSSVNIFKTSSPVKPLGQLNLFSQGYSTDLSPYISYGGSSGMEVCSNGHGHTTKMATMPIYGKNPLKIFFSRTRRLMTLGLGMKHWGCRAYQVCSNDDPRLTLTYFTPRSNLLPNAFKWEHF